MGIGNKLLRCCCGAHSTNYRRGHKEVPYELPSKSLHVYCLGTEAQDVINFTHLIGNAAQQVDEDQSCSTPPDLVITFDAQLLDSFVNEVMLGHFVGPCHGICLCVSESIVNDDVTFQDGRVSPMLERLLRAMRLFGERGFFDSLPLLLAFEPLPGIENASPPDHVTSACVERRMKHVSGLLIQASRATKYRSVAMKRMHSTLDWFDVFDWLCDYRRLSIATQ